MKIYYLSFICICMSLFFHASHAEQNVERTLAIIKPVAYKKFNIILAIIKRHNFKIVAMKKMRMSESKAEKLYHLYRNQPLFAKIVKYISSGPVVVMMLEKENAVKAWRDLIGSADLDRAGPSTLRAMFSKSKVKNAAHGSDSAHAAREELHLFFPDLV